MAGIPKWEKVMARDHSAYAPKSGPELDNDLKRFHAAIVADPWDYAPRGILADWLDENRGDDPELAPDLIRSYPKDGSTPVPASFTPAQPFSHGHLFRAHGVACAWVGRIPHFFQAIRDGLFLYHPIQRVAFRECHPIHLGHAGISAWTLDVRKADRLRDLISTSDNPYSRERAHESVIPIELAEVLPMYLWIDRHGSPQTCTRRNFQFESLAQAVSELSAAAVSVGREASGLKVVGYDGYNHDEGEFARFWAGAEVFNRLQSTEWGRPWRWSTAELFVPRQIINKTTV